MELLYGIIIIQSLYLIFGTITFFRFKEEVYSLIEEAKEEVQSLKVEVDMVDKEMTKYNEFYTAFERMRKKYRW